MILQRPARSDVVVLPALVYLTFGFYGGIIISKHLLKRIELMMAERRDRQMTCREYPNRYLNF